MEPILNGFDKQKVELTAATFLLPVSISQTKNRKILIFRWFLEEILL